MIDFMSDCCPKCNEPWSRCQCGSDSVINVVDASIPETTLLEDIIAFCDLIPPNAIEEVFQVLKFGLTKHPNNDWDTVSIAEHIQHGFEHLNETCMDSTVGTKEDESGLHHLAHAICRLLFALELVIRKERQNEQT